MIICHIITALGYGGAEKLLVDLANIQAGKHEVHIIYLKDITLLKPMFNPAITFHRVDLDVSCASRLRATIKKIKPEVVHTHLGHADLIGLWAVRGLPLKRFCTMHNIWFKRNWLDNIIIFPLYSFLFRTVAKDCKVIAISKSVARHCQQVLQVKPSNIVLLHNAIPDLAINESREILRKKLSIPLSSFVLLFVGRLEKQKSVDTLIRATGIVKDKIPGLQVLIIGDGRLRSSLQELASTTGLNDTIFFLGVRQNVAEYFSSSDVFVLPSIFEGFGIVIIEAFRSSVATIATSIEGPAEIIRDGENGLLFEPLDHEALADSILKLYRDNELRNRIAKNGHDSYLNKFDIGSYSAKIELVYSA